MQQLDLIQLSFEFGPNRSKHAMYLIQFNPHVIEFDVSSRFE